LTYSTKKCFTSFTNDFRENKYQERGFELTVIKLLGKVGQSDLHLD